MIDWIHLNEEEIFVIKNLLAKKKRSLEKEVQTAKQEGHIKASMGKIRVVEAIEYKLNNAFVG